jgi:quercetin dioxygenase-like cupin family protein
MRSKVIRAAGARWPELPVREYKDRSDLYRDVVRWTLLGAGPDEEALRFEVRYFEVEPGGFTTLESHRHPHAVVVLTGRGEVRLGEVIQELTPFDVVYVAPDDPHQFRAAADVPLGFLCVVDRDRDRPVPLPEK